MFIESYKQYITSKRIYLKRKKEINREIRYFKKKKNKCKYLGERYFQNVIFWKKDSLERLNLMYRYHKRMNKRIEYLRNIKKIERRNLNVK